jgi:hypothetical protein
MTQIVAFLNFLASYWPKGIADFLDALPDWAKDGKWLQIVLLIVIVHLLSRQRARLQSTVSLIEDRLIALRKLVEAVRDDSETVTEAEPASTNAPAGGREYWEIVRQAWASARNRIQSAIDERIADGRKRRRYANMPRYTYRDIILALCADKALSNDAAANLIQMDAMFSQLRAKPLATTQQQAARFEVLYKAASDDLPKEVESQLPLESQDPQPARAAPPAPAPAAELPSVAWSEQAQSSEAPATFH